MLNQKLRLNLKPSYTHIDRHMHMCIDIIHTYIVKEHTYICKKIILRCLMLSMALAYGPHSDTLTEHQQSLPPVTCAIGP